ncbi:hypothetical protein ABT300_05495 [Streptomyces sp. NPDC001027]|uniref:hypothetical protein n=1 Tax=Streptomyces sp. NPDC001027 TaxID=3154771 RepID=UPI003327A656
MPKLTRNPFGLMATPAPADIAREHADALSTLDFDNVIADTSNTPHTATVLYGPTYPNPNKGPGVEVWATPEMAPEYDFEAIYNPAAVDGQTAKAQISALLAAKGITPKFVDEDHLCVLCCTDLTDVTSKVPCEGDHFGIDGRPRMRCEPKCCRTGADIEAERTAYLADWAEMRQATRMRGTATPAMEKFMVEVERVLAESPDPAAAFDTVLAVVASTRKRRGACPVHAWCHETEPGHIDHSRYETGIVLHGAVHFSESTPKLYVGETEFGPEQAAAKAQELRMVAERIEVWAEATQQKTVQR